MLPDKYAPIVQKGPFSHWGVLAVYKSLNYGYKIYLLNVNDHISIGVEKLPLNELFNGITHSPEEYMLLNISPYDLLEISNESFWKWTITVF